MSSYDITSDRDLHQFVRAETDYADTRDELPQSRLSTLTESAKLRLAVKANVDEGWYSDRGLGLALLGVTCIKAKASVENHSVESWSIRGGDVDIQARDSDGESIQYTAYERMIADGMATSDVSTSEPTSSATNINSASYIS